MSFITSVFNPKGQFMQIPTISNFSINNNFNLKSQKINPNYAMLADTVSFSGKNKTHFASKAEGVKYYQNIADEVNKSLEDDDELTAFELLGYDVEADFDTDKIIIKGDYKPYFEISSGKTSRMANISYEKVGIDQEKLLKNVEKIEGNRLFSDDFVPDDSFVIDSEVVYPPKVTQKLEPILEQRTEKAKAALQQGDNKTALEILGYNSTVDKKGNLRLTNGYSHKLLQPERHSYKTLKDYDIDENELLKNVTQINGVARFDADFTPDHYIKVEKLADGNNLPIVERLLKLNPQFIQRTADIKQALNDDDSFKALQIAGYDVTQNSDGNITINGDYASKLSQVECGINRGIEYSELGINEEALLKDVNHVKGVMRLTNSKIPQLKKNIEIDETLFPPRGVDEKEFFANYISNDQIGEMYNLPSSTIKLYSEKRVLEPVFMSTYNDFYFADLSGENKEFLDEISTRRDEILTAEELMERYNVSSISIDNAVCSKELNGYKNPINGFYRVKCDKGYLFDISDSANSKGVKRLERNGKPVDKSYIQLAEACLRNDVACLHENSTTKHFYAEDLERLGYGSKADLIANCGIRVNAYPIKQYLLHSDVYDITPAFMTDILLNARHNNPALVRLSGLRKQLGENSQELDNAILNDKMNIITQNPYRLTTYSDYCVDLSDSKNLEVLKTIDNESFQKWLSQKIENYENYKKQNEEELEKFQNTPEPTAAETREEIRRQVKASEENRRIKKEEQKLEIQRHKDEISENASLQKTVAWALAPNTRQIQAEYMNPYVREILDKNAELKQIQDKLLTGEISEEEAEKLTGEAKLTPEEERGMLSFYKTCWEISGTEEWKQALKDANIYVEQYKNGGLDAVDNSAVKERLAVWEQQHNKN